jgi:hypothetical protein
MTYFLGRLLSRKIRHMSLSNQTTVSERRESQRHARALSVKWRILGARDYQYAPTVIQNISTSGMAFLFDEEFKEGTVMMVQFEGVAPQFAEPILLRVERATPQKNNKWQVGCSFSTPYSEDELEALLESARRGEGRAMMSPGPVESAAPVDPFIMGSAGERRKSIRRKRSSVAVFVSRAEGRGLEIPGSIVERSLTGLGIVVSMAFPRGTALKVRLQHGNVAALQVQVRNCRQQEKQWFLGCQFTQTPPANVFMLLG